MSLTTAEAWAWQCSWDRQQAGSMPDREHRIATMLDVVDAITTDTGQPPRILDLAGGTGSISLRLLRRHRDADITLLDLDPVLRHIAETTLPNNARIVSADLRTDNWPAAVAPAGFDAVLTATALHWLPADTLAEVYRKAYSLLRPGGVFINADQMIDPGLPGLSATLGLADKRRREALYTTGAATSWERWWDYIAADSVLGPLKTERDKLFSIHHSQEWTPDVNWHLDALTAAEFSEVGLIWRGSTDAAVAGLRHHAN